MKLGSWIALGLLALLAIAAVVSPRKVTAIEPSQSPVLVESGRGYKIPVTPLAVDPDLIEAINARNQRTREVVLTGVSVVLALAAVAGLWLALRRQRHLLRSGWARLFVVGWAIWLPLAAVVVDGFSEGWTWEPIDWLKWVLVAVLLPPVVVLTIRWVAQGAWGARQQPLAAPDQVQPPPLPIRRLS